MRFTIRWNSSATATAFASMFSPRLEATVKAAVIFGPKALCIQELLAQIQQGLKAYFLHKPGLAA